MDAAFVHAEQVQVAPAPPRNGLTLVFTLLAALLVFVSARVFHWVHILTICFHENLSGCK